MLISPLRYKAPLAFPQMFSLYFFVFRGLNLNNVNQLIFVMVKCGVLFEVWTGFLNNI
jgi:hypothetical protein